MSSLDDAFCNGGWRTATRLELLPAYNIPDEQVEFSRFLSGHFLPTPSFNSLWIDLVSRRVQRRCAIRRFRLIPSPLTAYFGFEIAWGYLRSAAVGEEIAFATKADIHECGLLGSDFWLFDDSELFMLRYDASGSFLGTIADHEGAADTARAIDVLAAHSTSLTNALTDARSGGDSHWRGLIV